MRVAVLDHGMGNLRSVAKALEAAGADVTVTRERDEIVQRDGLCVPGQGVFGRCMSNLSSTGFDELIATWLEDQRPYLGICLGMQVLFRGSEEQAESDDGLVRGLGLFDGDVRRLRGSVTIPHIGWNTVSPHADYFYFDHSYAVQAADDSIVTGWCEHGVRFVARIGSGPLLGVQFHPEKSGRAGIQLVRGWVEQE